MKIIYNPILFHDFVNFYHIYIYLFINYLKFDLILEFYVWIYFTIFPYMFIKGLNIPVKKTSISNYQAMG